MRLPSLLLSTIALCAATAAHAQVISEALLVFPAQTESLEYDNLAALRASPNYESLRQRFNSEPLQQAEATLAKLGISEDQVNEMALGTTPREVYGLLGGAFSGSEALKFASRKSIRPLQWEDSQMFCPGAGPCVVFLEDWLAAFGNPGELKSMLQARQGIVANLGLNPRFARMMEKSDANAPVRGVASGSQFDSFIGETLRDKIGMGANWAQFSSGITFFGYSFTFESKTHLSAILECKSVLSAMILKQMLAAVAQAGPKIVNLPFQNIEVVSSETTVSLKLDTSLSTL